jgi:hypothetical protein
MGNRITVVLRNWGFRTSACPLPLPKEIELNSEAEFVVNYKKTNLFFECHKPQKISNKFPYIK